MEVIFVEAAIEGATHQFLLDGHFGCQGLGEHLGAKVRRVTFKN
jgi:hypothetical protein